MGIVKFSTPFSPFWMDKYFGENDSCSPAKGCAPSHPSVNIRETSDSIYVDLAAPGLTREDFKVKVEKNLLSISVNKEQKQETSGEKFNRMEFSYHRFERRFTLPESIETESIGAKYENGVLSVRLPKREAVKANPEREIPIS